jgi:polyisoprenyl-teichoic acid--peptidoglycan teichoic acid transferase
MFNSRKFNVLIFLAVIVVTSLACSSTQKISTADINLGDPTRFVITAHPNATASPTPFLALTGTPVSIGALFPTATPTIYVTPPIPSFADSIADLPNEQGINDLFILPQSQFSTSPYSWVPDPMPFFDQPDGQFNILLLGSDQRPNDGGFRTDTIIMATVNISEKKINLTSFPRDLFVYQPGRDLDRINTAMVWGGFPLLANTFEYNFGVRPDHFVMINFSGFEIIIDTMGGINVEAEKRITDHRDKMGQYTVVPGTTWMDGSTALWYVRSRYSTSDFDRTRRQQEVLQAISHRILSFDIFEKIPQLFNDYQSTIKTDLTINDIRTLLPLVALLRDDYEISSYAIGREHTYPWVSFVGAQVLLPDRELVQNLMQEALNIPK